MRKFSSFILLLVSQIESFSVDSNRREILSKIVKSSTASVTISFLPAITNAEDLSEEEKARITRKMELLKASRGGKPEIVSSASAIRSDVNPDAAVSLRSRSVMENTKIAIEKQNELKSRDKAQKREDMCEMLGRGC